MTQRVGQWVAAFAMCGLVFAPRVTRLIGGTFAMIALADFLHQAYETANALNQIVVQRQQAEQAASGEQQERQGQEDGGT